MHEKYTLGSVSLFRGDDGEWRIDAIQPRDPFEDPTLTARMVLWFIETILWLAGKIRSRKVREEIAGKLIRDYMGKTNA